MDEFEQELNLLLKDPTTKQVFAYEEIMMPLQDYPLWLENVVYSSGFPCIEKFTWPICKHIGNEKINYWEMKSNLRTMFSLLNISPPLKSSAAKIYLYGFFQKSLPLLETGFFELSDFVWEMNEIVGRYDNFLFFQNIIYRYRFLDEYPNDSRKLIKNDIIKQCHSYLLSNVPVIKKIGSTYVIA